MHSCSVAGGLRRESPLRGAVPPATYVRGTDHLREQARYPVRRGGCGLRFQTPALHLPFIDRS
eukprot:1489050-Pleurochrysis_carterae.AAC.1